MPYLVKLSVSMSRDRLAEGRVRSAIKRSGGVIDHVEKRTISAGGQEQTLVVCVEETQMVHSIVKAIESVPGVAVREATSPEIAS